jgi:hypothetical protein
MKTFFILYKSGEERRFDATSMEKSSSLISFFRDESLVLVVSVSEITSAGDVEFAPSEHTRLAPGAGREEIERFWRESAILGPQN